MNGVVSFVTRNGEEKFGYLIHAYHAFEGGMRYIFRVDGEGDYRCVKTENGNYKELVI